MECKKEKNKQRCNCTYQGCSKKGMCCECLHSHLENKELPACCFPAEAEKTYDRSFEKFAEAWRL
ncbi:TPA: cytosolic protein [Candidatus Woesearchaeota archaeon]|nr:cytosolic protein [Candidatus Woesearchaeota archaeon]